MGSILYSPAFDSKKVGWILQLTVLSQERIGKNKGKKARAPGFRTSNSLAST